MAFRLVPAEGVLSGRLTGQYTLSGTFMQSPDYVPGVSGWAIFGNGSAEFNNGTFRGFLQAVSIALEGSSGEILVYSGPPALGNLIGSISGAAGADSEGNAYPQGLQISNGAGQGVHLVGAQLIFTGSHKFAGGGGGSDPFLFAQSATSTAGQSQAFWAGPTDNVMQAIMQLVGESDDGTQPPYAGLFRFNVATQLTSGGVPLQLVDVAAAPAAIAGGSLVYSTGGQFAYISGSDGNAYATGQLIAISAGQIVSSTSPTTVLSVPVGIGTYKLLGWVIYKGGTAAGTALWSTSGPAVGTTCQLSWEDEGQGTTPAPLTAYQTALGLAGFGGGTLATASSRKIQLEATITFTAAGTLAIRAAEGTSGDTVIIAAGSSLTLIPVA